MRKAEQKRKTEETEISLALDLDGCGKADIKSGVGFLDHMLTLFARHGMFDLQLCRDLPLCGYLPADGRGTYPFCRRYFRTGRPVYGYRLSVAESRQF